MAWGDSGTTLRWRGDGDADPVAARWHGGRTGHAKAVALAARTDWLAQGGIQTPGPTRVLQVDDPVGAWTLSPWCDGTLGAHDIGDPAQASVLASAMGALAARIWALSPLDPDAMAPLSLDRTWSSPRTLAAAARRWAGAGGRALDRPTREALEGSIDLLDGAENTWRAVIVHGDLVPINVIVSTDRRLVVLDLEHMAVGPPSLDAAWWSWVVRFHHPAAWVSTWPAFLASTGLNSWEAGHEFLTAIGRIRALQRAVDAPGGPVRAAWWERLTATAGW